MQIILRIIALVAFLFVNLGLAEETLRSEIEVAGAVKNKGQHSVDNRGAVNAIHTAGSLTGPTCPEILQILGENKSKTRKLFVEINLRELVENNGLDIWVPPGWRVYIKDAFYSFCRGTLNNKIADYVKNNNAKQAKIYDMRLMDFYDGKTDIKSGPLDFAVKQ